ncbi:hypothetical protein HII17_18110 [Thalassotalea sp. M1531]|uniref:Uncharacterized protein n=1 Tax=Thalassotalea algicola TaxID=2716224 RepID=A0A7Y0LFA4_9GAMM|nr:hypothetical protein [Thalassotalea algicola]NMP33465.1 hypothetical protein [Thalassotalea algicola]
MKYSKSENKIIQDSYKYITHWKWHRYALTTLLFILLALGIYLIFHNDYGIFAGFIGGSFGILLSYLIQNWSVPKKEALIVKLVKNQKST